MRNFLAEGEIPMRAISTVAFLSPKTSSQKLGRQRYFNNLCSPGKRFDYTRENYGQAADNSELEEDRKWFVLQLQGLLVVVFNILHLEII